MAAISDLLNDLMASLAVTAMDEDAGTLIRQPERYQPANAIRGTSHQNGLAVYAHACSPDFALTAKTAGSVIHRTAACQRTSIAVDCKLRWIFRVPSNLR